MDLGKNIFKEKYIIEVLIVSYFPRMVNKDDNESIYQEITKEELMAILRYLRKTTVQALLVGLWNYRNSLTCWVMIYISLWSSSKSQRRCL